MFVCMYICTYVCMYNYDACVNAYNVIIYVHMHVWYPLYDNVALVRDLLTYEACELIEQYIVVSMDLKILALYVQGLYFLSIEHRGI